MLPGVPADGECGYCSRRKDAVTGRSPVRTPTLQQNESDAKEDGEHGDDSGPRPVEKSHEDDGDDPGGRVHREVSDPRVPLRISAHIRTVSAHQ